MNSYKEEIRELLSDIREVTNETYKPENLSEIVYSENPLNPNLLAYCFDIILGFKVEYRIAEKVNYWIEFDYKGTFAQARDFKLSYNISIDKQYKSEFIELLKKIKPILEQEFLSIGEQALILNQFTMENEAPYYLEKLYFYEKRIETLQNCAETIREKTKGQWDIKKEEGFTSYTPKGQEYIRKLTSEVTYDIIAYIDSFFSALEHVLILLFPFTGSFHLKSSYYKNYIQNTRWTWSKKIVDVFWEKVPQNLVDELKRIKEIYRNHNAHGSFSREMMAYVQIPSFGRYPLYIGKEYLKGFFDVKRTDISFVTYCDAKRVFSSFWDALHVFFEIPMMFIESGLPIPVDTNIYMQGINNKEAAQFCIDRVRQAYDDIANMDW